MKPLEERRRRSAREWFANCPFAYAAYYVHELSSETTATRRGSCFHEARQRYIRSLWAQRIEADHDLAQIALTQACVLWPLPYAEWMDVRQLWARFTENYMLNLTTYYSCEDAIAGPFGADLRLDEVHVPNEDTIRAIDAKTWWRIPSQSEMAESFQTRYYLAAMRRVFPGFTRYELQYDLARYGTHSDVITADLGDLDEFEEYIAEQDLALAAAEEDGRYPAMPGAHCRYCVARCPLVEHEQAGVYRAVDSESARRIVDRLAVLHRDTETLTSVLRGFAEQSGPVESGGIEWAFRPTARATYNAAHVLAVLEEHGVAFNLKLSATAVKPLITSKKKYVAIADEIKALAQTTVQTKFLPKRVAMGDDDREYEDTPDES